MKTKKMNVRLKQMIEGIYACSVILGCMIIFSRPMWGTVLLVTAFLTGYLGRMRPAEEEKEGAPAIHRIIGCRIHAKQCRCSIEKQKCQNKAGTTKTAA